MCNHYFIILLIPDYPKYLLHFTLLFIQYKIVSILTSYFQVHDGGPLHCHDHHRLHRHPWVESPHHRLAAPSLHHHRLVHHVLSQKKKIYIHTNGNSEATPCESERDGFFPTFRSNDHKTQLKSDVAFTFTWCGKTIMIINRNILLKYTWMPNQTSFSFNITNIQFEYN